MAEAQGVEPPTLHRVARALRRRLWVLAICATLVPVSALAFSLSQENEYTATAELLFRDPGFDQKLFGGQFFAPSTDPEREAATNTRLVSLDEVAARTADRLKVSAALVEDRVETEGEPQSNVVTIRATDEDPEFAAKLANSFGAQFIDFRRDADQAKIREAQKLVERQLARLEPTERAGGRGTTLRERADDLDVLGSLQTGNAELVQKASPPSSPSSPNPVRDTVLAAALGLLLGLGLALLLDRMDRRVKEPSEVEEIFDRPVVGAIPFSRALARDRRRGRPMEMPAAESFRMLRANLRYFNVDRPIKSILVTSPAPRDGKSTVAWNLASTASGSGGRTLLIDADLRHPSSAERGQLTSARGLSNLLAGDASLEQVVQRISIEGRNGRPPAQMLDVVTAGPLPPNPTDLMESNQMRELILAAEREYDLVVIDTPPTSVVSDAVPLVTQVSGVIVVCRLEKTTRGSVEQLRNQLLNLGAPTLGVVINALRSDGFGYGYGYGYGHPYGYGDSSE